MITTLEAWSKTTAELAPEHAEAVAKTELVSVRFDHPPDRWLLVSDSRVGVVRSDDWELRVVPRLAIPKLMFLLGYASDPRGWRDAVAAFGAEDDLFAAVASGFAYHAQRAVAPAPLRGYVTIEDRATTLRGRLRVADQIARWPGMPIPLELTYDDHTPDIPENRLVRGAAELLLRVPGVPPAARKRLLRVRATLEDVLPAWPDRGTRAPALTRLNQRYAGAIALAELILRHASITTTAGEIESIGFVFDMNAVFEDFLSAALTTALERIDGHVELQYGRDYLDDQRGIRLKPDITWWRRSKCVAVIDAKYKPLSDERFPNADAYQMLAYCTALGLRRGYLVYAKEAGEKKRTHDVRNADTAIEVSAIDVEQTPAAVLRQVDELAREIAADSRRVRDQSALT